MKTILVPTDFSEASHNASLYALELAKILGYQLLLYHAYHVPVTSSNEGTVFIPINPEELKIKNLRRIREEAAALENSSQVKIGYLTSEGFAEDEILNLVRTENPELIIMGMTTSGAFSEHIMGSIATDIIRKSNTPVMIIPEKVRFKRIEKVVFASEQRAETDIKTDGVFKDILERSASKMYILNVVKENKLAEVGKELSDERLKQYFNEIDHTYHFLEDNDLIHGLNEFIAVHKIDMITMVPHKHNLLERVFKEPSTKKMAFHTSIPLLTLPEKTTE